MSSTSSPLDLQYTAVIENTMYEISKKYKTLVPWVYVCASVCPSNRLQHAQYPCSWVRGLKKQPKQKNPIPCPTNAFSPYEDLEGILDICCDIKTSDSFMSFVVRRSSSVIAVTVWSSAALPYIT
jgi:hypothetical protein